MPACDWCGAVETDGTPCPSSIECPRCHAAPGQRCRRPSEHAGPFVAMHADRYLTAEAMAPESPPAAQQRLVPVLGQQIDLDGQLHDLSPQTRQESLFGYDAQLAGQTYIDTTNESETDHAD